MRCIRYRCLMTDVRELAERDPQRAFQLVEDLTLQLVADLPVVTGAWNSIALRDYGRAHTLLDDAGILVRQAARVLLGLPAAGPRAEQEMVDQALTPEAAISRQAAWTRFSEFVPVSRSECSRILKS